MVCTGPITYKGHAQLKRDIDNLKAALNGVKPEEVFMPAISPSNIEDWQKNAYYKSTEEYIFAIADAMREEYEAIVDAGFLVQIDDPRLVTYYIIHPEASIADCRKWAEVRVEALNHALRNIAPEKIRFHTCYGINMGPRIHDMELKDVVDIILKIRAGAYSFEAANPAPRARMESMEERQTAGGQNSDPGRNLALDGAGRACRARRRAHRPLCRCRWPRECDSRLRLRLRHLRRLQRGASFNRLGEVQGARRRRADRLEGIVGQTSLSSPRQSEFGAQAADRRGAKLEHAAVKSGKLDDDRKAEPRAGLGFVQPLAAQRHLLALRR